MSLTFFNLFKKIFFYYFLTIHKFSEALAQRVDSEIIDHHDIWALYRLSCFEVIANSTYTSSHWHVLFAKTVSLAACGREVEAKKFLYEFKLNKVFKRKKKSLAVALAPFNAQLALDVLQSPGLHPQFYAALLLRVGRIEDAAKVIASISIGKSKIAESELCLLKSNASALLPLQQLECMNRFLAAYSLPPLLLINEALPPSVTNIKSAAKLPAVNGPLVSVLMTAYNSANFIVSTIESILAQTYHNIEVIVVDDASDDNTVEVVMQLAQKDSRIMCFSLPCNAGTFVAKTVALKYAKGEFVTCHDSDDWSHPLRIQRQIEPLLKNKRLVATTSLWVRVEEDGTYYARHVYPLMRLNPASPLFRREEVLKHAGGWDLVKTGADSEFIARLKLVFGRGAIKLIVEPLAFGAHRPGSLMTASDTGYTPEGGTNNRLAYWDAWMHWHINTLRKGCLPKLSSDLTANRAFPVPQSLTIPKDRIEMCLHMHD